MVGSSAASDPIPEFPRGDGMPTDSCCILNGGGGAWAFATLAHQLGAALGVDVCERPRAYNYLLVLDDVADAADANLFIPLRSMELAADKRLLAEVFAARSVPTPETRLVNSMEEMERLLEEQPAREWCLKYPTSCGASGHRLLVPGMALPKSWPRPFVVQEFIRLEQPEVFRLYGAGGDVFGWVARRFPAGVEVSPWVAHARGARYELDGQAPEAALAAGRAALEAAELLDSFGCVDLLRKPSGEWVVLEVGTDGMYNHVDRDLGCPELEREVLSRIADAFWKRSFRS
jgi:hypothetical protein